MRIKREQEMEASFEVIAEPDKDMIQLTMSGFFAEPDIRRMRAALMVALTELHCAPNQYKRSAIFAT